MAIGVRWGAATDAGRVRELNEDSLLAEPPLFAVADGVGGHAAGEVASGIAVAGLGRFVGSRAVEASSVLAAVRNANVDIRAHATDLPQANSEAQRGMGSTVVGLALSWSDGGDTVLVFNVGDSRVFCLSEGRLVQISRDHSLVDELLRAGHISAEEALVHPHRSVITRALGAAEDVDVDSWQVEPRLGDRYLLCSDGLTNEVGFDEVQHVLSAVEDPQEAAQQLVQLALDHGGRDNVTAVVVEVSSVAPNGGATGGPGTLASPVDRAAGPAVLGDEPSTKPLPSVVPEPPRPRPHP
ncbi:MAG TPA: PP2C family serine/threonine-protein phosphatase [Frankiaceae bacterium]|nr:PP2C family serine/threonine-protein phosphatase [Frankiaceae bacterium]